MKLVWPEFTHPDRMTRAHAWLLSCSCAAILLLSFPLPGGGWTSFEQSVKDPDETEIDSALQAAATAALGQREGAIIVMDAQTGRVRALVNPKTAFAEAAMPGSTMKPFTALAALRAGLIDQDSRTVCPGRFTGLNFSLPCVHADYLPPFTPSQAIAYSCNYYFATLGQRLGRDNLIQTLRSFGFGQLTGLDEDVAGTLKPCETGNSARIQTAHHASAQTDCTARAAIGESDHIQVTPIQLLVAYTALVNGGHLLQPRVTSDSQTTPAERATIDISPQHRAIITQGMAGAVRYGTARNAHFDSLPLYILGKTGTSAPPKGFRAQGWFVGFAAGPQPQNDPKPEEIDLAVLVLLERSHGAEAAALSKPIFEAYANARSLKSKTAGHETSTNDISRTLKSEIKVHLVTENSTQELSLEDYVLGVMRAEGSMEKEPEALKALAVTVRTYALKNRGRHAKDGYDFCSTTHCQRFVSGVRNPAVREGSVTDQALPDGRASDAIMEAVRSTAGQVLLDDRGQLVEAYFGASCGGETANVGALWGVRPPEYLRGVRDEYCVSGPHAHWSDTITRADLLRALQSDARTNVGARLDQVVVSKRDETGRAEFVTLEGEQRKSVRGWDFKIIVGRVLGWNLLKSSRFEISRAGSNFIFRGSGFGHGLGLCQEGAHVMAARGQGFERILEKYFPGTSIRKEERVESRSSGYERSDPDAEDFAEGAEENLCVPLRNPLRPLRLNASFQHQTSLIWKADLLTRSTNRRVPILSKQPRSGALFIVQQIKVMEQLRRSEVSSAIAETQASNFAPTELANFFLREFYKHFVPTGLHPSPKFLTISSEHFRVTYPADTDRRDANQVLSTLDSARADFLRRANAASIQTGDLGLLEIRLNDSTGDFTTRTGQPWWAAAATRGNRIELQPVILLKRRGVLVSTLRHELAHVVIDKASHNRAPRWLEEGFALYLAGEGPTISHYLSRGRIPTDELEKKLARPGSQEEMHALYAQAYNDVFYLVRNNGEASVWQKVAAR